MAVEYGSLPFEEQITFFKDKLQNLIPTERWTDVWKDAHDTGFMVAGALKADLLADLHAAVLSGIEQGTTLEAFRKDFKQIVAARGWTGWTGEGTPEGEAWRTRVIYDTNMYSSYAAGRYAQATDPELVDRRPYWRYRHNDSVLHPRPLHVSWNGLVLRYDDPWWQTHFPPNGWGCQCYFETLRQPPAGARTTAPDDGEYVWRGETIPKGIDPGWDYTPGATTSERLRGVLQEKAVGLPEPIGAALTADLKPPTLAAILADSAFVENLAWFRDTAGWTSKPQILRDITTGEVTSRTGWLPKEAWWQDYHRAFEDKALNQTKFEAALNRALAGKRLGTTQEATIEWLYEYHTAHFANRNDLLKTLDDFLFPEEYELHQLQGVYNSLEQGEGADWLQWYLNYIADQQGPNVSYQQILQAQIQAIQEALSELQ